MSATAAPPVQDCKEKEQLHTAYRIAVSDYTRSFGITKWVSGTTHKAEYERLRNYVHSRLSTSLVCLLNTEQDYRREPAPDPGPGRLPRRLAPTPALPRARAVLLRRK
jgi:hypothetical protein